MLRTFLEHECRPVCSLDGLWDFLPGFDRELPETPPKKFTRKLECPAVWESLPDLRGYRGQAWFRREFEVQAGTHTRIVFGGVSHTAQVFVDGKEVGGHYDAFTPWDVVVSGLKPGRHEVAVKVDNTFGPHSALHVPNDYYTYGGITRPVELHAVPDLFLDKLLATPVQNKDGWALKVRVRVRNVGAEALGGRVVLTVAGQQVAVRVPEVAAGETGEVSATLKGLTVKPWCETSPILYRLVAGLFVGETLVDDKIDRVGFRVLTFKGGRFALNGKPLHLRGFNRHEDHPMHGCAVPAAGMAYDLGLFADMHCNFLRTCHYPNDMRLLDMCDERGIYVWEESHARQVPFDTPNFDAQIHTSTVEMVENHYNHPCIVIWGSLNECETRTDRGVAVHTEVMGLLKALDGTRPVTYAAHLGPRDRCQHLVDIVSFNLYTGWYGGKPERTLEDFEQLLGWLDTPEGGGKGKPVIVSEFGGGAIYGCRNPQADPWSEEGQCVVLDEALKAYLPHKRVVGACIWQFCDIRVSSESNNGLVNGYTPMGRPRCMNNKGVVDEYRRPKLSYEVVKTHMRRAERLRGKC